VVLCEVNGKSLVGSPAHDKASHRVIAARRSDYVVVVCRAGHDIVCCHVGSIVDSVVGASPNRIFFSFFSPWSAGSSQSDRWRSQGKGHTVIRRRLAH